MFCVMYIDLCMYLMYTYMCIHILVYIYIYLFIYSQVFYIRRDPIVIFLFAATRLPFSELHNGYEGSMVGRCCARLSTFYLLLPPLPWFLVTPSSPFLSCVYHVIMLVYV